MSGVRGAARAAVARHPPACEVANIHRLGGTQRSRRRPPLNQAARRAAWAGDECEGKERVAGASSCWSRAGFAVLIALRRRRKL